MWGPSLIGFEKYYYKYKSRHEGEVPLIGFSPRKSAISLYVFIGFEEHEPFLLPLGKIKRGKACLYINQLSDIDLKQLKKLSQVSLIF